MKPIAAASSQPDLRVLRQVNTLERGCSLVILMVAAIILCGWLLPLVGSILPVGWALMKANTALGFAFAAANLALTRTKQTRARLMAARACALAVLVIAGAALFAYSTGRSTGLETVWAADSSAIMPGRMSIPSGLYLELAGLILLLDGIWQKPWFFIADLLAMTMVLLIATLVAGSLFDAADLFGQTISRRVAPHSLLCMMLLAVMIIGRRTRGGFFAVLVGESIGSQAARVALPFALVVPFVIVSGTSYSVKAQWLSKPYAAALAASACSILMFAFVVIMARRVNDLERTLRDMSLSDELTKIYNRRAFYLLGEHGLTEARRAVQPMTVLYFDLNDLKKVNDSLGHDVGSQLLIEAANLLRANFRASDVVARVGGDEFAVVTPNRGDELVAAFARLDRATAAANRPGLNPYRISYSMGMATFDPDSAETFAELVQRADAMMYARKRDRKAERSAEALKSDVEGTVQGDTSATGVMAAYVAQSARR